MGRSDASGDLGRSLARGKKEVAPNAPCLADHPVLCLVAQAEAAEANDLNKSEKRTVGESPQPPAMIRAGTDFGELSRAVTGPTVYE